MSKSKGADAPKQEKEVSSEKFLNLGVDVQLRNGERVTVKELSFSALISVLAKAANALSSTAESDFLTILVGASDTQGIVHEVFALSTGKDVSYFSTISASDGFKLIAAVNQVNDFAEIFSVFQQMGLQKILPAFTEQASPKG